MAGLPNITGYYTPIWGWASGSSRGGSIVAQNGGTQATGTGGKGSSGHAWTLDASVSSPVYGASQGVTPSSISCLFFIKFS